jgi:hypothetical protein
MQELDLVVLARGIEEHHLEVGDVGAIVHAYSNGAAFEVEFVTAEGTTVAVLTLTSTDIRPLQAREILHARPLAA